MGGQHTDLAEYAARLVKNAELPENRTAIVVDPFTRQTIIGVKRVDPTQRKLDAPSGRRQASPTTKVCPANHDFDQDGLLRHMPALNRDLQIRQRLHELLVERADSIPPGIVFLPGLVIVMRGIAEGSKNAFQIVSVLKANVLLNNGKPRRVSVVGIQNFYPVGPGQPKAGRSASD